jgi:hypothetical protein
MKKAGQSQVLFYIGLISTFMMTTSPFAMGKNRLVSGFPILKPIAMTSTKGIQGEALLTVQQKLQVSSQPGQNGQNGLLQFQDGNLTDEIEFYRTPRCYMHFQKNAVQSKEISAGKVLRVSKIDNVYSNGAVHVTFWFDNDAEVMDLSCITNYDHTLTVDELKGALGNLVNVSFTKSVETGALFNTVPIKGAKILTEESTIQSARVILQGT